MNEKSSFAVPIIFLSVSSNSSLLFVGQSLPNFHEKWFSIGDRNKSDRHKFVSSHPTNELKVETLGNKSAETR